MEVQKKRQIRKYKDINICKQKIYKQKNIQIENIQIEFLDRNMVDRNRDRQKTRQIEKQIDR